MSEINLSVGHLKLFELHCYLSINMGAGMVWARAAKIESELSRLAPEAVKLMLILEDKVGSSCAMFDITPDDFHTLAQHLPADCIEDRLNLLKNEDHKKGAFDATDQVTPKAILLNDMTMSTGE